ncbi:ABC transporter substrate-binding protein [Frankia canadensis]|uniref:ABC transporter substrate-binding protein n=1 Tax=Frankia canadensis TaxID=1836972 RepID=UPI001401BCA1|nr:ABC transporter substrate-binding protein [Frankia canadensis]
MPIFTATAVAAVTAVAACSSGGSSDSSGDSKSPIKIMVISTLQSAAFGFPEAVDGAEAAAAKINAAGGVDGHQIEISSCNDQFDPNTASACAQKAVSEKLAGVVTGYTSYGNKILPVLAAAKIPFVGLIPATDTEWKSSLAFPFGAGSTGNFTGVTIKLYEQGCKKLGSIASVAAASIDTGKSVENAFKHLGGEVVYTATIPPTAADVSPQVAALVKSGAECVVTTIPPAVELSFIKAAYAAAPDMPIGLAGIDDEVAAKVGPAGKNIVKGDTAYPATSNELKPFVEALHAFNASAAVSSWSLNAYDGVEVIAQAAKGLDKVDAASITAALSKSTSVKVTGYPEPIDFSKPQPVKGLPRLFNPNVVVSHFDGKHFIAFPKPVNVLSALQAVRGTA